MSKKQARQKKMSEVNSNLAERAAQPVVPKTLILTPQIAVAIHGAYPDQYLVVEQPNQSGSRKKVQLTQDNAYRVLMDILMEKAGEIELERQLALEARNKSRRSHQPDWWLIAQHPQAEIRQGLTDASLCAKGSITILPTKASQLSSLKAEKTLEDMGL